MVLFYLSTPSSLRASWQWSPCSSLSLLILLVIIIADIARHYHCWYCFPYSYAAVAADDNIIIIIILIYLKKKEEAYHGELYAFREHVTSVCDGVPCCPCVTMCAPLLCLTPLVGGGGRGEGGTRDQCVWRSSLLSMCHNVYTLRTRDQCVWRCPLLSMCHDVRTLLCLTPLGCTRECVGLCCRLQPVVISADKDRKKRKKWRKERKKETKKRKEGTKR